MKNIIFLLLLLPFSCSKKQDEVDHAMKSNFLINEDGMIAELNIIEDAKVSTDN